MSRSDDVSGAGRCFLSAVYLNYESLMPIIII